MATRRDLAGRVREVVRLWIDLFAEHDLLTYASAIAFQVLKSLIPLSLLGIALLGEVGRQDIWTSHMAPPIRSHLDPPVFHAIDFAVKKIFRHDSGALVAFAAALTVWYVSGGVRAIMGAINQIYEAEETRPFWIRWPISLGLALAVVAGVVGALLLVEAVPTPRGGWVYAVVPIRWLGAGAVLVLATWIVTTLVFRWYVASLANFRSAVGQLAVFLVLMIYVYASSIVLLVGVELDELLREDASSDERGILHVLFGLGR